MSASAPSRQTNSSPLPRSAAWLNLVSIASLALLAPLFLFPVGRLPWLGLGLALLLTFWRWGVLGRPSLDLLDIPLLYLLLMALLGLAISADRSLSWPRFWSLLYGLLVFAALRRSLDAGRDAPWIAAALALGGLGLAVIGPLGADWSQVRLFDLPWLYDRLPTLLPGLPGSGVPRSSELINPRWLGISLGVLAPVYLALLGSWRRPWLTALLAAAFLLATGVLILTQSIQGLLGLLVGCLVVLLFVSRWFWLLLPAGGLGLAGMVIWFDPQRLAAALLSINHPAGIGVVLRLDIWSRALAMLHDMPYTGIGLNTFPLIQSQFYTGYLIGPEPHAHNLYLQTALDTGLPGLLALLSFLTIWAVRILKRLAQTPATDSSQEPTQASALVQRTAPSRYAAPAQGSLPEYRLLLIGVLAGLASYLAHGFIDAMMLGAKPAFIVWVLLGIGAAYPLSGCTRPKTVPLNLALAGLALPLVFALLALLQPASVFMNLGALSAQRVLYPFPPIGEVSTAPLAAPQATLQTALRLDPARRQAHLLLGRIASLQGEYAAAEEHYAQRVALDLQDPIARYNPAQHIQHWLAPPAQLDPAAELLKIYRNWNARFPERAEGYLLLSLLATRYQEDPARGQAYLQAGVQAGARPLDLLLAALGAR